MSADHSDAPEVVRTTRYPFMEPGDPVDPDDGERWSKHDDARYTRKSVGEYVVELLAGDDRGGVIRAWEPGESSLPHVWKPGEIDGEPYHAAGEANLMDGDTAAAVYSCIKSEGDVVDVIAADSVTDLLHLSARENVEF